MSEFNNLISMLNDKNDIILSQQAKIDELKKLRSLDEMAINQLAQANQVWQIKCGELQARIDGLTIKLNGENERAMSLLNHKNVMVDKMQAEIDELQKRIDGALKSADINFWNSSTVKDMVDILKGNKDEN